MVQYPLLHIRPEQQGDELEHVEPDERHAVVQYPLLHIRPEQHGYEAEHVVPEARQGLPQ
ncbi:MAG: hypothetical protein EPO40_32250 [Myxococcaceae bacterium]|nr:MAG: hypothetical protein EPO40_32250 [Myxococcaceae bacterium]